MNPFWQRVGNAIGAAIVIMLFAVLVAGWWRFMLWLVP